MIDSMQPTDGDDPERLAANGALIEELQRALHGAGLSTDGGEPGISEAATEIQPAKRKRGRPKKYGMSAWGDMAFGYSEAKSTHGKQNSHYAYWAAAFLFKHHKEYPEVLEITGYSEPTDFFPEGHFDMRRWKLGILAELGRIICHYRDGEEAALQLAVELASMTPRPTVKQAIAWIRNRRPYPKRPGSVEGVVDAITKAVDDYWARHPDTPNSVVVEGLINALGIYDDGSDDETWTGEAPHAAAEAEE